MAWSWLQSASHPESTSATTVAATFASNLSRYSKLIALVVTDSASSTPAGVSDGTNSFTAGPSVTGSTGGGVGLFLYFLDTPAGDVGTKPTITASGLTSAAAAILIAEVAGLLPGNTTACLDGTGGTKQATSTASDAQPAYTSHAIGEFLITCLGDNGGPQTWTNPGGYQGATAGPGSSGAATGINNNSNTDIELAYANSTNGAESGNWGFTGTLTGTAFIVVAFKLGGTPLAPGPPSHVAVIGGRSGLVGAAHSR